MFYKKLMISLRAFLWVIFLYNTGKWHAGLELPVYEQDDEREVNHFSKLRQTKFHI